MVFRVTRAFVLLEVESTWIWYTANRRTRCPGGFDQIAARFLRAA
jgi:hypothetical protein